MGLLEEGQGMANRIQSEQQLADEHNRLASIPYVPEWFSELFAAVQGRVKPVAFYENNKHVVHDRTPFRGRPRTTTTYSFVGRRWSIIGATSQTTTAGEAMSLRCSFDASGIFYGFGQELIPRETVRHKNIYINHGLVELPARSTEIVDSPWKKHVVESAGLELAALATHQLASGEFKETRPGVINVGHLGR